MRRAAVFTVLALALVIGIGTPMMGPSPAHAAVVSTIVVSGNTRVEDATVESYVLIVPGQSFGNAEIDESVKALYGTGLFSDVAISVSGNRLLVVVEENSVVNTVVIQGNRKIKSDVLLQLVQSKPRGVLTEAKLEGDRQRMIDYYSAQGRSAASIEYTVTDLPGNRADVVFIIDEGDRTAIGRITFIGNDAFSESRLRSVISSRKRSIRTLLNRKDVFSEAKLAADQEALRRFYMSHGYADFRVISVDWEFNEATGRYSVVFTIDEGQRYRFGEIAIDSTIPGVDTNALMRQVKTRTGRVFNSQRVEETVENLTIALSRAGYAFVQVRPRGDRNFENHTISITYLIDEGPRVYVERIEIIGNTKTRDYVIRREFDFAEGDAFNRVLVDRAERKLRGLNYFETVEIVTEPGSAPDRIIVIVRVVEEATGEFAIGAGYGSGGFIAEVSLDERNFLGRGQQLRIAVGFGQDEQSYTVSFTDPYFLGYNISAGVDAYNTIQGRSSFRPYRSDTIGGRLRFGLPITDDLTVNAIYKLDQQEISETAKSTSVYFPNGTYLTSAAGYSIVYSTIDNFQDPSQGTYIKGEQEFAGLGGDVNYMKSTGDARYYAKLMPDRDVVGFVRGRAGNITGINGKKVMVFDNFFQGSETIRGFSTYGFGPVDAKTKKPLGGKNYWNATAEVQFPFPGISPDFGFRGAVFADAGTLVDVDVPKGGGPIINSSTIRSSVGGSVMWASPIGTLRADMAYVLSKAKTDDTQWFKFSAGRAF
ncbi:outer membrane protein assembly factor BamA [Bauldia sp.]|uniref:outer membrane protein assembly factor BamA n=1 Tax=Bauldia sp. TaxID=2575872 RepID=UPI003BAD60A8